MRLRESRCLKVLGDIMTFTLCPRQKAAVNKVLARRHERKRVQLIGLPTGPTNRVAECSFLRLSTPPGSVRPIGLMAADIVSGGTRDVQSANADSGGSSRDLRAAQSVLP